MGLEWGDWEQRRSVMWWSSTWKTFKPRVPHSSPFPVHAGDIYVMLFVSNAYDILKN